MKKTSIFSYLFFNKKWFFAVIILVIFSGAVAELIPYLQGRIVSSGVVPQNIETLFKILLVVATVVLIDAFCRGFLYILANKTGFRATQNLRDDFFKKLIAQNYEFFTQKRSGDMVFRSNLFIYSIGNFLSKNLADIAISFARAIIIFAYMLALNFKLALILGALYLVAILFATLHSVRTYKLGKKYRHLELHRNSLILQNLDNMETYLAYNDNFEYPPYYNNVTKIYHSARDKFHRSKHLFYPLLEFIVSIGTVLIYILTFRGGLDVINVGILVAFLAYSNRLTTPIGIIADGLSEAISVSAQASKLFDEVATPAKKKTFRLSDKKIDIFISNLADTNMLTGANFKNINLEIPFKSHVAITGSYGSGKTAFSEVLLGLSEPLEGTVKFNQTEVDKISPKSLCKIISAAEDDVAIFEGTLYDNIAFARPSATAKEVLLAVKKAGLEKFMQSKPEGIMAHITPSALSESAKQLISFARIILKDTPIVIIDEFARDLDPKTQKLFHKALEGFTKNKTLIYICQTAPDDLKFDQIIKFKK